MKLKKVEIHKYKSFETEQKFDLNDGITILVGMNESGKTAALEAIAKTNYFENDEQFKFNLTHDYPRAEKKKIDKSIKKSGEYPKAVTCTYEIPEELLKEISEDVGQDVLQSKEFSITSNFSNSNCTFSGITADKKKFIALKTKALCISSNTTNEKLEKINSADEFDKLATSFKNENYINAFKELKKYFEFKRNFNNPIEEYVARVYLDANLPKFLYYDEYFTLPSRISIEKLEQEQLEENDYKTAKALFELADINTDELLKTDNFENFIAELEATGLDISQELFKYWKTNKKLEITFQIDKKEKKYHYNDKRIIEHILDVRVKSKGVSLPLKNRSKGFNWFFSFLVWFKKIQEDKDSSYILLLDEPGLNLHAAAQSDLLKFLRVLSKDR